MCGQYVLPCPSQIVLLLNKYVKKLGLSSLGLSESIWAVLEHDRDHVLTPHPPPFLPDQLGLSWYCNRCQVIL